MHDQERLLKGDDPEVRALLESALRDRAPAAGLERTALALGLTELAAPNAALDAASHLTTAAQGSGASAAATTVAKTSVLAGTGQWLAIGLLAGSAASGTSFALHHAAAPPAASEARMTTAARPTATPRPPLPALDSPTSATAAPAASVAAATPKRTEPARASSVSAPGLAEPSDLTRETALIDAVRGALRRGDNGAARSALSAYGAERRLGVFDREALLLSVELALNEGAHARAVRLAADFETKYPNDAHLPRLRALIAK